LNKGPSHLTISIQDEDGARRDDAITVEEPIEIWIGSDDYEDISLSITMRTPGDDRALVLGFLFSEGIISSLSDIDQIALFGPITEPYKIQNQIKITLRSADKIKDRDFRRDFYSTSSCGVCGKASIQALAMQHKPSLTKDGFVTTKENITALPKLLREFQEEFRRTGGLHGIALVSEGGQILSLKEDVGRHNAMDKLIGELLITGHYKSAENMVLVSGRASFEIVQKALMADIPFLASIGAPSSAAIDLAKEYGMTLVGFLKSTGYNVYCGEQRIR
tara:strand:+ start:64 stop:894 length:831 start_codon:yes stop_codon:yes gene_type:complete